MRENIISSFHNAAKLKRSDVFDNDALTPIASTEDAHTAAPGWVGAKWREGTLLVGINPGGGGDNYRLNPSDERLYTSIRGFRDAENVQTRAQAFAHMTKVWSEAQQSHNIWRVVKAVLDATGESASEIAFMNILPFRTRLDAAAPIAVLRTSWLKAAGAQIAALQPKRVIALGKKAGGVLSRFDLPTDTDLLLFKRGIGDSYIPAESQELLARLAKERCI